MTWLGMSGALDLGLGIGICLVVQSPELQVSSGFRDCYFRRAGRCGRRMRHPVVLSKMIFNKARSTAMERQQGTQQTITTLLGIREPLAPHP